MGEVVSEVISQAAATSFIHMQMLAVSQVNHNIRNTGELSGAQADKGALSDGEAGSVLPPGLGSDMGLLSANFGAPSRRRAHRPINRL
ncbi:hypothetical protein GCM10027571_32360 [Polaromonas eurypsychrophila]